MVNAAVSVGIHNRLPDFFPLQEDGAEERPAQGPKHAENPCKNCKYRVNTGIAGSLFHHKRTAGVSC